MTAAKKNSIFIIESQKVIFERGMFSNVDEKQKSAIFLFTFT